MIFLFILIGSVVGGGSLGLLLLVGMMLWDGKWTLPHTNARAIQREKVQLAVLEMNRMQEIKRLEIEQVRHLGTKQLDAMINDTPLPQIPTISKQEIMPVGYDPKY